MKTVFQFLKARHLANRVFATADAVKEQPGKVWSGFATAPDPIRSLGIRAWAHMTPDATPETPTQPEQAHA